MFVVTRDPYRPPDQPITDISTMASQFLPLPTAGFSTQEEAVAYMQTHGLEHGYALKSY